MKNFKNNISVLLLGLIITVSYSSAQNPANKANEFDYAGKIHNEISTKYLTDYKDSKHDARNVCSIAEGYTLKNAKLVQLGEASVDCDLIERGADDYANQFRNVVKSSELSSNGKAKAQELIDYMFELAFKEKNTSYNDFYNYVVAFENEIISNRSFASKDKKMLLSGASVARHSSLLWMIRYNQNLSKKSTNDFKIITPVVRRWWEWAAIGVADVAGTIIGTIGTGISASSLTNTLIKDAK